MKPAFPVSLGGISPASLLRDQMSFWADRCSDGGGNLGFGRDGSHAECVAVPESAVLPLPKNLGFEEAAGIGVAYITAWAAIVNAAQIQAGETALILGTTGAVGRAAARISHKLGARVIGTVRKASDIPAATFLPVDEPVLVPPVKPE